MIYKISAKKDDFLENIFKESFDDLNAFYGINWKHHIPKIVVVNNRKTINLLKGEATEDWLGRERNRWHRRRARLRAAEPMAAWSA